MIVRRFPPKASFFLCAAFLLSGCVADSITPPPTPIVLSIKILQSSVVAGGTVGLTVNQTGTGATTVSYYVDGVQGGNAVVGTITSANTAAVYTAPNTVPTNPLITLTVVSNADPSKSASVTLLITPPTVSSVGVVCTPPSILTGQTSACIASVGGTGSFSQAVTWAVTPASLGTVSSGGVFTATSAGTATVMATAAQDGTTTGSTKITVTVPVTITAISVMASPTTIAANQTAACTALVSGTGAYSSAVTWSATNGTITSSGDVTPSADGTTTCTATSVQDPSRSASASISVVPAATVSDVAISCASRAVPVSQSSRCTAAVTGTGNPSSAVTWSVNGIAGGNSMFGTVDASGVYTSPSIVPTPYTVNVTATSVVDTTKSASAPLIVAGTMASATQFISAASGGTITLPDGSSIAIDGGLLPIDSNVTLTEMSYLPDQPPNTGIALFGPGLIATFEDPAQFSLRTSTLQSAHGSNEGIRPDINTSKDFKAFINFGNNWTNDLVGAIPIADIEGTGAHLQDSFIGALGSIDDAAKTMTADVKATYLNAITTISNDANEVKAIVVSAANLYPTLEPYVKSLGYASFEAPNYWSLTDQGTWSSTASILAVPCSSGKILILVPGMLSQVTNAFPQDKASQIKNAGGYAQVYGFDYDWTQRIEGNGNQLAALVDLISTNCHPASIDIEAHSEGSVVSMYALTEVAPLINHFFSLGGPILGTPVANDPNLFASVVANWPSFALPNTVSSKVLDYIINHSPFVGELIPSAPGSGDFLDTIRRNLASSSFNDSPQIFVIAGSHPHDFLASAGAFLATQGVSNSDGVIPVASALAFQGGVAVGNEMKVYPFPPFDMDDHFDLPTDTQVITKTTNQSLAVMAPPNLAIGSSPSCDFTVCLESAGSTFHVSGSGFDQQTNSSYELLSSGQVNQLLNFAANNGFLSNSIWQDMSTTCSTSAESIVYFAETPTQPSNAVTQEVTTSGSCVSPNAIFTVAVDTTSQSITAGQSASFTVTFTSSGGFAGTVTPQALNWQPQIPGATASWSPTSVPLSANGTAKSVFTVVTSVSSTTPGNYAGILLQGSSGALIQQVSTPVSIDVTAPVTKPNAPTGLSPGSPVSPGPTETTGTPTFSWSASAGATSYNVVVLNVATKATVCNQSSQTVTASCPALPSGDYIWNVVASNSAGTSLPSAGVYFTVAIAIPVPTLTSLTSSPAYPGLGIQFFVTLNGTNFLPGTVQVVVTGPKCAGTACTIFNNELSSVSSTQIVAPFTLNNPGTFNIVVQNGSTGTASNALTITIPIPVVTSVTPTTMKADGANGHPLTIYGSNFQASNQVQFLWTQPPGNNQWTNAKSGAPTFVNSGELTITMNPGTVTDKIYARVCVSSTQTTASDCSSGAQYVSVAP